MKKKICTILSVLPILLFSACSAQIYEKKGFSNFHKEEGETGITLCLMPSEDFFEEYSYVEGDYYYYDTGIERLFPMKNQEGAIIYLKYEEAEYEKAKAFCLDNMVLSETSRYSYNDYIFVENIERGSMEIQLEDYGIEFNMFVYNDENETLLFLGYFLFDATMVELKNIRQCFEANDLGDFLKKYFSFYDFDA